jgi:hypothetical protein
MADWVQPASRGELPRREVMQTPDEVAAMLRLKALGWGVREIAGELGLQPHDGSSIFVSRRLDSVSRSRSAADAEWTRGVGGGAFPPVCRQRRCGSPGA